MAFNENLNYCMEKCGYSAYRFAQILGVNNQSVLNWQHGDNVPHTKTRIKIAEHFGLTLEEMDGDKLPEPNVGIKKDLANGGAGGIEGIERIDPEVLAFLLTCAPKEMDATKQFVRSLTNLREPESEG